MNSRLQIQLAKKERAKQEAEKKPTNTSKGEGLILEAPYKPGFVDHKNLETVKMAVDKELSQVANAFHTTTERTAESIKRLDKLELQIGDGIQGVIAEEAEIRKEQDGILSRKIDTVKAESSSGIAEVKQTTSALSDGLGKIEAKWGVQTNVNDKIAGIQLNNDGKFSSFSVIADSFTISNGTFDSTPPFEVVGSETRIKSALVENISSDNYTPGVSGWNIDKDGKAEFSDVFVRGHVEATSGSFKGRVEADSGIFKGHVEAASGIFNGTVNANDGTFNGTVNANAGTFNGTVNANAGVFNNVTINENCQVLGTLYADRIVGLPTGKSFGTVEVGTGGEATLATLSLANAEGRFTLKSLLAGRPMLRCGGSSSTYRNKGRIKIYLNGVNIYNSPEYLLVGGNWVDVAGLTGLIIDVGSHGGTLTIKVARTEGPYESVVGRWEGLYVYSAIDR